jgi:hypothetical protein
VKDFMNLYDVNHQWPVYGYRCLSNDLLWRGLSQVGWGVCYTYIERLDIFETTNFCFVAFVWICFLAEFLSSSFDWWLEFVSNLEGIMFSWSPSTCPPTPSGNFWWLHMTSP